MEFLGEPLLSSSDSGFIEETSQREHPASYVSNDKAKETVSIRDLVWTPLPSNCDLYSRALAIVSRQEKTSSKVLKAPFLILTVLVGLWPERCIPSSCMMILGVVINVYILLGAIFIWKVCGLLSNEALDKLTGVLCYGSSNYNHTKQVWQNSYSVVQWVHILFSTAQFFGYILIIISILKVLPHSKDAITLKQAYNLLTRKQWIRLNLQIMV